MNVSTSMLGLLVAEEVKPVRTGSLPFKKRRFPRPALSELNNEGNVTDDRKSALVGPKNSAEVADDGAPSDERIAALALVAASATSSEEKRSEKGEPKKHGFSFYEQPSSKQTTTLTSALVAAATDLKSLQDAIPTTDADVVSGKRVHRPPLTSPLPNGCHGRTSRNNSYCRRQPYNGSHFCKSHYQNLIVSGLATEEELKNGKVVEIGEMFEAGQGGALSGSPDGTRAVGTGVASVHQQDKRYTGAENEIRCKATTTRGRDCSYCAVNRTKYCHLHATFDTNPPPRRGGASVANAAKGGEGAAGSEAAMSVHSKSGKAGKLDGQKRKSPSMSARRLSTTKNLEKHMAHAPYPLLSTLPTVKWLHKKVIVSTGPLTNHVGLVEKWGNGWISVRLPGVGLHNRRSFELYLHPNPDSEGELENSTSADNVASRVEVFDTAKEGAKGLKKGSDRTIPEGSTPPTPLMSDRPTVDVSTVHEVTPLTSCRVIGLDQELPRAMEGSRRVSSIMFPTCFSSSAPTTVPESPVPERGEAEIGGAHNDKAAEGGARAARACPKSKLRICIKAPPVEAQVNDVPLMQSLLLAHGKRSTKNKIGMLFGTAALERSRRHIHKPKRYGDTELIAKKPKKRDREAGVDGPVKRQCAETDTRSSSATPSMISSSEEESADAPARTTSV